MSRGSVRPRGLEPLKNPPKVKQVEQPTKKKHSYTYLGASSSDLIFQPLHSNTPLTPKKLVYSCDELTQFIRFFPSNFTLGLQVDAWRIRYIVDEVMLSIQTIPVKFRAPQYNLLGYLFALQGNYNYAFRYFHEVSALQENNTVSIANQAHCYLRQEIPEKAHGCLKKLIKLTSSSDFMRVTKESLYMSEAKTDLGYAYSTFGLNNASKRMFESALKYNSFNFNASFGLAKVLTAIAQHEGRSRREFYLRAASDIVQNILANESKFVLAKLLSVRLSAERKVFSVDKIDKCLTDIMTEHPQSIDAKILRDMAYIKLSRFAFDGELGSIELLQKSLDKHQTAEAFHLLGRSHQMKWHRESKKRKKIVKRAFSVAIEEAGVDLGELKEGGALGGPTTVIDDIDELMALGSVDEDVMCKYVLKFYEQAVKKSYNSNLESILELGILCGKLDDLVQCIDLLTKAAESDDTSIQERAFRNLAIYTTEPKDREIYIRNAIFRQAFCKLSDHDKREFHERIYDHAEEVINDGRYKQSLEWIEHLIEEKYKTIDTLVEMYNKESSVPIKGLNGEVPLGRKVSRKHSVSRKS